MKWCRNTWRYNVRSRYLPCLKNAPSFVFFFFLSILICLKEILQQWEIKQTKTLFSTFYQYQPSFSWWLWWIKGFWPGLSVTMMCLFVITWWTRSGSLWIIFVVGKVIFCLDQFPGLAYWMAQPRLDGTDSAGWCCSWLGKSRAV